MKKQYKMMAIIGIVGIIIIGGFGIWFYLINKPETPIDLIEPTWEIDDKGYVTNVVDGDTVDVDTQFHGSIRIRLADIDAPELGDEPYYTGEATKLNNILYGSDYFVFIDIDDIFETDVYGRTVAVLYTYYYGDTDKIVNINYYMINEPYTVIDDYYNEFNPYEWTLFVEPII